MERALRKTRIGVVISNKMDKTVSVAIERKVPHPIYKKYYTYNNNNRYFNDKNYNIKSNLI